MRLSSQSPPRIMSCALGILFEQEKNRRCQDRMGEEIHTRLMLKMTNWIDDEMSYDILWDVGYDTLGMKTEHWPGWIRC